MSVSPPATFLKMGYGRNRRRTYGYRRRRGAATVRNLTTVGLVEKHAKPIEFKIDNMVRVQSFHDPNLRRPPLNLKYGRFSTSTPLASAESSSAFRTDEAVLQKSSQIADIAFAHDEHNQAARAFVLNFGPSSTKQTAEELITPGDFHPYNDIAIGTKTLTKRKAYVEERLSLFQLHKSGRLSTNTVTGNTYQYKFEEDDFGGDKIFAKNTKLSFELKCMPQTEQPLVLDESLGVSQMTYAPASNAPSQNQILQWIAAGAKIRVRYLRVLEKQRMYQREVPNVATTLFRDWDNSEFGLFGADGKPSNHNPTAEGHTTNSNMPIKGQREYARYMKAQVNKSDYKIISHSFFTMTAPKGLYFINVPIARPLVTAQQQLGYNAVTNVVGTAAGDPATNAVAGQSQAAPIGSALQTIIVAAGTSKPSNIVGEIVQHPSHPAAHASHFVDQNNRDLEVEATDYQTPRSKRDVTQGNPVDASASKASRHLNDLDVSTSKFLEMGQDQENKHDTQTKSIYDNPTGITRHAGWNTIPMRYGGKASVKTFFMKFNYKKALNMEREPTLSATQTFINDTPDTNTGVKDGDLYQTGHTNVGAPAQSSTGEAGTVDAAGPQSWYEPMNTGYKNHKMIWIFEPQGVDPRHYSMLQNHMPAIQLSITGQSVYSSTSN